MPLSKPSTLRAGGEGQTATAKRRARRRAGKLITTNTTGFLTSRPSNVSRIAKSVGPRPCTARQPRRVNPERCNAFPGIAVRGRKTAQITSLVPAALKAEMEAGRRLFARRVELLLCGSRVRFTSLPKMAGPDPRICQPLECQPEPAQCADGPQSPGADVEHAGPHPETDLL